MKLTAPILARTLSKSNTYTARVYVTPDEARAFVSAAVELAELTQDGGNQSPEDRERLRRIVDMFCHEGGIECDHCGARSKACGGTATSSQVCPKRLPR